MGWSLVACLFVCLIDLHCYLTFSLHRAHWVIVKGDYVVKKGKLDRNRWCGIANSLNHDVLVYIHKGTCTREEQSQSNQSG